MSDDGSSEGNQGNNTQNTRANSEKALSEHADSQTIGKSEEMDVEPPEGDYVMAPTPNNPNRGDGNAEGDSE